MNKRLKELAEQAGMEWETQSWCWLANPPHLEHFAALVRADALEEAAKKCESMGVHPLLKLGDGGPEWYKRQQECAIEIRQLKDKT